MKIKHVVGSYGGYECHASELIPGKKYSCAWYDNGRKVKFIGIEGDIYPDGGAQVCIEDRGKLYIGASCQLYDEKRPHTEGEWM